MLEIGLLPFGIFARCGGIVQIASVSPVLSSTVAVSRKRTESQPVLDRREVIVAGSLMQDVLMSVIVEKVGAPANLILCRTWQLGQQLALRLG